MPPGSEVSSSVTSDRQSWLRTLWDALTGPSPALTDPHHQLRARLLSSMLIFLIPLGIALAALPTRLDIRASLRSDPVFGITLGTSALLIGLYALSRTRHYQYAARFAIVLVFTAILSSAVSIPTDSSFLTFMILPVMMSSLLFTAGETTIIMIAALTLTACVPLVARQYNLIDTLMGPFSLTLIVSTMLLLLLDHRDRLEHHRRKTLEELIAQRTKEVVWAHEQLEAILSNAPDSMMLLSAEGRIATINQTFIKQLGYSGDEIFYQPIQQLVIPRDRAAIDTLIETAQGSGVNLRMDITAQRKDGSTFDADIALAFVRETDSFEGFVCSLRDISQLKEVDRMKDAFISNVSHELRTPITSLKLYYELLGLNPQKYSDYFNSIQREMQRLERIVEDLLLLSRLEQGRVLMDRDPVDLNSVARDMIADRTLLADSRELTLILTSQEPLPGVSGDPGLIGQVLSILLTNSINYTPANGKVCIMTHVDPDKHPGQVGLVVMDTGPGIQADERDQLFTRFYRGQASREANVPGTGLGLAIACEIVERHGGTIEIDDGSTPAHDGYSGACFNVWLPMASGDEVHQGVK
jgi:PAS domain S-box-containing protein